MIYDINKRLDMTFSLSTPLNSYVLSTIVKDNQVPINVFTNGNDMYFSFFLSRVSPTDRALLETFNPVLLGDIVEITEKIDNPVIRAVSENTNLASTLANGELFTKGRGVYTSFRFHSSQLKEVGNLLKAVISLYENIDEIRMVHSEGIIKVLDEINTRIPLSAVTFAFTKSSSKKFALEWRNILKDPFGGILYDLEKDGKVENYDMLKEPTSKFLRALDKDHIPLASHLEFHGSDTVKSITHVPSFLLKPFLVRLYENTDSLEGFKILSIENYLEERERLNVIQ